MGDMSSIASGISAAAIGVIHTTLLGGLFDAATGLDQRKIEEASINLEAEQAKFEATRQAEQASRSFRSALASQVAMTSFRGGSGSLTRQFGAESFGNFLRDQQAFERGLRLIDVKRDLQQSQSRAALTGREIGLFTSVGKAVAGGLV